MGLRPVMLPLGLEYEYDQPRGLHHYKWGEAELWMSWAMPKEAREYTFRRWLNQVMGF